MITEQEELLDSIDRAYKNGFADGYDKGKTDAIDEVKRLITIRLINNLSLENATKYGNKDTVQQANSYSTVMKYEIADCIDDLLDDLEQLKEQSNEYM